MAEACPTTASPDISRQCHRADLHAILAKAFDGPLHLGHALIGFEETTDGVRACFANGDSVEGDALIAADGVRSAVRPLLVGEEPPRFTGQIAYRFLVDRAEATPFLEHGRGAVFIGPAATFNRYTLRAGSVLNCVGIAATEGWADEGWSTPVSRDEMLATFAGWHDRTRRYRFNGARRTGDQMGYLRPRAAAGVEPRPSDIARRCGRTRCCPSSAWARRWRSRTA